MSKHNIELPPLPLTSFHARRPYETEFTPNYSVGHMRQYARAAIEPYKQRISELEAQLEAIGAGGVSGQRITGDRQRRSDPVAYAVFAEKWKYPHMVRRSYSGGSTETRVRQSASVAVHRPTTRRAGEGAEFIPNGGGIQRR